MKTVFFNGYTKALFALILVFAIYSCETTTTTPSGPEANTISGRITFVDTNFTFSGGYYDVAAFSTWPPMGPPSGDDSLVIVKNGNTYTADYKISGLSDGQYVIALGWRPLMGGASPVMGIYGCDTAHSGCGFSPPTVSITNSQGVENINFLCWADTSKKIF